MVVYTSRMETTTRSYWQLHQKYQDWKGFFPTKAEADGCLQSGILTKESLESGATADTFPIEQYEGDAALAVICLGGAKD